MIDSKNHLSNNLFNYHLINLNDFNLLFKNQLSFTTILRNIKGAQGPLILIYLSICIVLRERVF